MKKISAILILLVSGFSAFSQISLPKNYGFRLGLTATPTIGWIKPEKGKTDGVALGFSYGLIGDFNFAPNYSFSTGLTITSINGKSTEVDVPPYGNAIIAGSPIPQAYDLKYKMQYIEIPLTIKLKTIKRDGTRYYGQFGLNNGFNISAKQDAKNGNTTVASNLNISDYTNFYRAALVIGGGGEFDISGNTSIVAGVTLNNGFTNITKDKNRDVRSHYLALNFGVFF
ncbi:porin family protein [Pedobacter sandarakinus]|uniref:porin family protein n=1 Tax=Pedobacter sandarakinus TaxID=353156 RepID=UPI002247364B|nr:porin family protein [Pedobacter sandarakinus]MCX2576017.1 porin family protein [Pedobacter sandarakinus]